MILANKKHKNTKTKIEEPVVESVPTETVVTEEVVSPEYETAIVDNCKLLNIREAAVTNAEVITTLPSGTEVVIDKSFSDENFYRVTIKDGLDGYCMKKFITIKP